MAARIHLEEFLIMGLTGQIPEGREYDRVRGKSPEECAAELRKVTGQDFGLEAQRWQEWFDKYLDADLPNSRKELEQTDAQLQEHLRHLKNQFRDKRK